MSEVITPTVWLRLLCIDCAKGLGRYRSRFAALRIRSFVRCGMYRASGASFSTMETVDGENPDVLATSLMLAIESCRRDKSPSPLPEL